MKDLLTMLNTHPELLALLAAILGTVLGQVWKRARRLPPDRHKREKYLAGLIAAGLAYLVPLLVAGKPLGMEMWTGLIAAMFLPSGVYEAAKRALPPPKGKSPAKKKKRKKRG